MPIFKVTLFCQNGASGWTESLYNGSATLGPVQGAAQNYALARQAMMCPPNKITAVKISDVETFRSAQYQNIAGLPFSGTYPLPTGQQALPPRVSIGIRMGTANGNNRVYPIRGLPSGVVVNDQYNPADPWNPALTIFKNFLLLPGNGWCLASPNIFGSRFQSATQISAAGVIQMFNTPAVSFSTGQLAGLHRIRGLDPEPNRAFHVIAVDMTAKTITILGWGNRGTYAEPFTVTQKEFAISQVTTAVTDVLSTRKTGRVPFLLRGRRSPDR